MRPRCDGSKKKKMGLDVPLEPDLNDGKPWSEMDIADLKNAAAHGAMLVETARFLCRSGSLFDVAMKAKDLGLKWQPGASHRS